jgi:hypothetical protein
MHLWLIPEDIGVADAMIEALSAIRESLENHWIPVIQIEQERRVRPLKEPENDS